MNSCRNSGVESEYYVEILWSLSLLQTIQNQGSSRWSFDLLMDCGMYISIPTRITSVISDHIWNGWVLAIPMKTCSFFVKVCEKVIDSDFCFEKQFLKILTIPQGVGI